MKIVFFAHFAGSLRHGMVFGHYYLAREWVRSGHDVTIVAAAHAHTRSVQPEAVTGTFTDERIDGIRYVWVKTPRYDGGSAIGRVLNIVAYAAQIRFRRIPVPAADLVICSSHHPLAIYGAERFARRSGARLVFEVRDLWPLTLIELGGASRANPLILAMQRAEDRAYRVADAVVSVLEHSRDYMVSRGMRPEKFHYVPNGCDDEPAEREPLPDGHREMLDALEGRFVVGYAGRVGLANALDAMVEAIAQCRLPGVVFVVLGDGSHLQGLRERAAALGVAGRVVFLPAVRKSQVPEFLHRIDAAYIGLLPEPLFRFGVSPTKLNDYLLAAKPVICAIDSRVDAVEESGAIIQCAPSRPDQIVDAIERLHALGASGRSEMGARGLDWISRRRKYSVLAAQFLRAAGFGGAVDR